MLCLKRVYVGVYRKKDGPRASYITVRRAHGCGALSATKPVRQSGGSSKAGLPEPARLFLNRERGHSRGAETALGRGCSLSAACAALHNSKY